MVWTPARLRCIGSPLPRRDTDKQRGHRPPGNPRPDSASCSAFFFLTRACGPGRLRSGMELDPTQLDVATKYKLMIGSIVPRPIALVSTVSPEGALNVAPFSFFNGVGSNPMMLLFCPANKPDGTEKDSLRNAKPVEEGGVGQFVINVSTDRIVRKVAAAAEPLAYGESEFELAGFTAAPSKLVKPPRVAESPVAFECETTQVIRTNPREAGGGNIVIGRVVSVHVEDELLNERMHVDQAALDAVGRMGGLTYCRTRDRFDVPMGVRALEGV